MFNTIVSFACICYVSVCIWRIKYYYYNNNYYYYYFFSLGVMAEALRGNFDRSKIGVFDPFLTDNFRYNESPLPQLFFVCSCHIV